MSTRTGALLALTIAFAAGCRADDDNPGAGPGASGHIVYTFVARLDGQLVDAIHVLDLAANRLTVFQAIDDLEGGVSAASDGTLAQLGKLDDAVEIRITDPDGGVKGSFVVAAELSFATSGAAISPDATRVAFSVNQLMGEDRGERTFVCPATGPASACVTFDGVTAPAWTPDGRLMVGNVERTALYLSDAAVDLFTRVDTTVLEAAENPIMTADGKTIILDTGDIPHLSSLDVATGRLSPLTTGGLGQFRAALSPDGKMLLFQQKCCSVDAPVVVLHAIPFSLAPTATPLGEHTVDGPDGDNLAVDGRVGWF